MHVGGRGTRSKAEHLSCGGIAPREHLAAQLTLEAVRAGGRERLANWRDEIRAEALTVYGGKCANCGKTGQFGSGDDDLQLDQHRRSGQRAPCGDRRERRDLVLPLGSSNTAGRRTICSSCCGACHKAKTKAERNARLKSNPTLGGPAMPKQQKSAEAAGPRPCECALWRYREGQSEVSTGCNRQVSGSPAFRTGSRRGSEGSADPRRYRWRLRQPARQVVRPNHRSRPVRIQPPGHGWRRGGQGEGGGGQSSPAESGLRSVKPRLPRLRPHRMRVALRPHPRSRSRLAGGGTRWSVSLTVA
jgi:hypothetical protein